MNKRILYIRSGPYEVKYNSYNLQEIGLSKALCEKGYIVDIVYYNKKKNYIQEIDSSHKIRILWSRGIKILRTGIYPKLLKKDFLAQYDIVIVSEYNQLMAYLISKKHQNVYIYNGVYYNLFKLPFMEKIYDTLFCKKINKNVKKIFTKTNFSKEYLLKKGINNTKTIGVGLDTQKFDEEIVMEKETQELLDKMKNHNNILYVGSISKRKNVMHIIKCFIYYLNENNDTDTQLVIIGKDQKGYMKKCIEIIPDKYKDRFIWINSIKNSQLKFVYKNSDVFLLPSIQEIFGMVLLEAMYFELPVISSNNAGANTLIENGVNGYIIDNFREDLWAEHIKEIISNKDKAKIIGKNASETIIDSFMWSNIADKIIKEFSKR